jgi:hypothetical protein
MLWTTMTNLSTREAMIKIPLHCMPEMCNDLQHLLEDVLLETRLHLYLQYDGVPPHLNRAVKTYINHQFPG